VLTILDMQPRQTGGGTGKSSDTIVYEMASGILERVVDKLDIDEAKADMFEVSEKQSVALYMKLKFLLCPGRGAEYCDQPSVTVCVSLCLSASISLELLDRSARNFVC